MEIFAIMSCVFVTGIVLRFLEVSQSLSIKNKIAAMIPIRHGSKKDVYKRQGTGIQGFHEADFWDGVPLSCVHPVYWNKRRYDVPLSRHWPE